ncbi:ribosomal protein S18-alanine N-acetyltransferase [Agromyces albus]|uniref:ribosomal protein S18-alanine N-acetyltransferase n=1 Tax=Agromyces albus TaxID=205332 RepID=UPI002782AD73|nr:ribosomal protein S18-alanine N-acetyltransferase [Agromyces albus]MDQ0576318.1 ribosomal-protein-alanine N-acetyltransferase [Agromyces albus]
MSVLMRRAKVEDLDAIMRLERETFVTDAWPEDAMRRELESPHGYYLVAVDDAAAPVPEAEEAEAPDAAGAAIDGAGAAASPKRPPVGLLGYAGLLAPAGSGQGDIQTIAVAPAARGMGLGRGLMHALITQARRRHVAELFLEVRADNAIARALYASLGFRQIGVRRGYYQPDGVDAITMRLEVPAAVTRPAASGAHAALGMQPRRADAGEAR